MPEYKAQQHDGKCHVLLTWWRVHVFRVLVRLIDLNHKFVIVLRHKACVVESPCGPRAVLGHEDWGVLLYFRQFGLAGKIGDWILFLSTFISSLRKEKFKNKKKVCENAFKPFIRRISKRSSHGIENLIQELFFTFFEFVVKFNDHSSNVWCSSFVLN